MYFKSRKKLIVVSHTSHYCDSNGFLLGWAPTVNEINFLSSYWEEIVHIACFNHTTDTPQGFAKYTSEKIRLVKLPYFSDIRSKDAIMVISNAVNLIYLLEKEIVPGCDIQLRLPTGFSFVFLPYLALRNFFKKRNFVLWAKYGGNWIETNTSVTFKAQRLAIKWQFGIPISTINGRWLGQRSNLISFENPCLYQNDIELGFRALQNKNWGGSINFIFIGRLEIHKGINLLISAIEKYNFRSDVVFHIIGDGPLINQFKDLSRKYLTKIHVYGFVSQREIHNILIQSHFLILPSLSEGFPKVVAEGACFGCIPIVSNISCINQYITSENGFLLNEPSVNEILEKFGLIENLNNRVLKMMSTNVHLIAHKFTYEAYYDRLSKYILK